MPRVLYIIIRALIYLAQIYIGLICVTAILSWFVNPMNRLMQFLRSMTAPVVEPFRRLTARFMPANIPIDISPLLAYFALQIVISILSRLLVYVAVY